MRVTVVLLQKPMQYRVMGFQRAAWMTGPAHWSKIGRETSACFRAGNNLINLVLGNTGFSGVLDKVALALAMGLSAIFIGNAVFPFAVGADSNRSAIQQKFNNF